MASSEGWIMGPGIGRDGYESAAQERARERAEAVEARMHDLLTASVGESFGYRLCPECEETVGLALNAWNHHLATCELLRARAEREIDNA